MICMYVCIYIVNFRVTFSSRHSCKDFTAYIYPAYTESFSG